MRNIIHQLVSAVKFLHSEGITHRDIKPENILLSGIERDGKAQVKLTDFGFSTFFVSDQKTLKICLGTPDFMAPEIRKKGIRHNEKVDVWAIAILTYVLLTRHHPFKKLKRLMIKAVATEEPDYDQFELFSQETVYFIKQGLMKEP